MRQSFQAFRYRFLGFILIGVTIVVAGCSESLTSINEVSQNASPAQLTEADGAAATPTKLYWVQSDTDKAVAKINSCHIDNCTSTLKHEAILNQTYWLTELTSTDTHLYWIHTSPTVTPSKVQRCDISDCANTINDLATMAGFDMGLVNGLTNWYLTVTDTHLFLRGVAGGYIYTCEIANCATFTDILTGDGQTTGFTTGL